MKELTIFFIGIWLVVLSGACSQFGRQQLSSYMCWSGFIVIAASATIAVVKLHNDSAN